MSRAAPLTAPTSTGHGARNNPQTSGEVRPDEIEVIRQKMAAEGLEFSPSTIAGLIRRRDRQRARLADEAPVITATRKGVTNAKGVTAAVSRSVPVDGQMERALFGGSR